MDKQPKFKKGDKVIIHKYGSLMWVIKKFHKHQYTSFPIYKEDETFAWLDMQPSLIGKSGIIDQVSVNQNMISYAINGIPEKYAWYKEDQLKAHE